MIHGPSNISIKYTQLFDTNYDMVLWASVIPELTDTCLDFFFFLLSNFVSVPPRDMLVQSNPCFSAHCEK